MTGDGYLALAYTRCNAPDRLMEWSAWYDDTHLPALCAAGVDVVTRFELTQQPVPGMPSVGFSHLAIYEFRGEGAEERLEATLALNASLRSQPDLHPNHCVMNVDVLRAHGSAGSKSDPSSSLQGHILAYVMCNQPGRESEWDAWYDSTHLPDMMASGAFAAGSRWFRRVPTLYGANHLTLYDVAGHTVEQAVELSAKVMPGITAAGRKLDCHVGGLIFTVRPCGRYGGEGFRPTPSSC